MKKKKLFEYVGAVSLLIVSFFLTSYYFYQSSKYFHSTDRVKDECISLCKQALANGTNLSNGPCLSNHLTSNPDWVCDVAHWPREAIDNNPKNQCSAYGKTAHHFVEVTPHCEFIRMY